MFSKNIYFSSNTDKILKAVFPSDFKLTYDKTNNCYKLVNSILSPEFDAIRDSIDKVLHDSYLDTFDYSQDSYIYKVNLIGNINSNIIYGTDGSSTVPIKITNEVEFNDGVPTRLVGIESMTLSGVPSSIVGIEYFRETMDGSGYFILHTDIDPITQHNSAYQTYRIDITSLGTITNVSGFNTSVKDQDYNSIGFDEVLTPLTKDFLQDEYPAYRYISAPISGIEGTPLSTFSIDHYTPFNGYFWNNSTYIATGYNANFYYDDDTGNKIYYRTCLNNPYGSGNYNAEYLPLQHIPISGTLKLFDIDNLDISGNAVEIPSTGKQLYIYSSGVSYIGYSNIVPVEYCPNSSGVLATPYNIISWDYCHISGGIDSNFDWIEYPNFPVTNKIKIVNPYSKYLVTYQFASDNKANYITSSNSNRYVRNKDENYIYSTKDTTNNKVLIPFQLSKDPNPDKLAVTFDGLKIRPGSVIDEINLDVDISYTNVPLITNNITLNLNYDYIGYTNQLIPNRVDYRTYLYNTHYSTVSVSGLIMTGDSSVTLLNYDTTYGLRLNPNFGSLFISGQFISMEPYISSTNNRFYCSEFKFYDIPSNPIELISSSNSTDQFCTVTINTDGMITISDQDYTLYSLNKINFDSNYKQVIVERDFTFEVSLNPTKYNLYMRDGDGLLTRYELFQNDITTTTPSYNYLRLFKNAKLDIKSVQIYEEPREYSR